jgi:hypothetical protein
MACEQEQKHCHGEIPQSNIHFGQELKFLLKASMLKVILIIQVLKYHLVVSCLGRKTTVSLSCSKVRLQQVSG